MRAACGRARSGAWSAWSCRSSRWSISTSITEDMPELDGAEGAAALSSISRARSTCARSAAACCMGTYERAGVPWSPTQTPWDFGQDLLPNDLERIAPEPGSRRSSISRALRRPGIKKIVNGPFTFAPDGNPLVGPVPGLQNFWVACGVMAGFSQGGGVGLALVATGWSTAIPAPTSGRMDVARYGDWATLRLHQHQGARELFAPLPHSLSQRGAAGGAPVAHHADLRAAAGRERRVRRVLRAGTSALVRAVGHAAARGRHLPPLQRACACRGRGVPRGARRRRPAGDLQLRQVRGRPGRRGRVARPDHGQQGARTSAASR